MRTIINPPTLAQPSGFAHAVIAGGVVYLAGQTALTADGTIANGGMVAQFEQALRNVLIALAAAGGAPADLVSVTIYLTDIPAYQRAGREIGHIWKRLCGSEYPAMVGVGVSALWQPEAMIEIAAIAHTERGDRSSQH